LRFFAPKEPGGLGGDGWLSALAPPPAGRYMQRQIAAEMGGFLFRRYPQRGPGKMVEVSNLLKRRG
jgi:hypothetical protein